MEQIELISKRKPREKHFLQKDGTIKVEIYDTDIHYLKNGKYEEIDNTLVQKGNMAVNKANNYGVVFNDNYKESVMKVIKDDNYIDFKIRGIKDEKLIPNKRKISTKERNKISNDITDNMSIEYEVLNDRIKETIVLKDSNIVEFEFFVDTNTELKEIDGEIVMFNKDTVIFRLGKPYMIDSSGERSNQVYYSLLDKNKLKLKLDKAWLEDKIRKFPINVDPTIIIDSNSNSFEDTFIFSGDTNISNHNLDYLIAGTSKVNNINRINRTLIRFDLPEIGTADEIVSAQVVLLPYIGENTNESYDNFMEVHRVTQDWHESTAKWNNMNDKYDQRVEEMIPTYRARLINNSIEGYPAHINITGLVKKWYQDTPNYGIMLKAADENYLNESYPMFFSSNTNIGGNPKPRFIIEYRNNNGLESYWDYKKQVYSSGNAYVNTHTGNLTTMFKLGHTVGGSFPAHLELVYNTNDVILNNQTFFGKGYKLSLEQEIIIHNDQLEYIDGDGTSHFFNKHDSNSNLYYDNDGLKLTIEEENNKYILCDVNNTKKYYEEINNKYLLSSICDSDNNTISIIYNNDNSIQKVVDTYNSEINISYTTNMITITSSDNTTVKLHYNTNNQIESIENQDGFILFSYNSDGIIITIEDYNGMKNNYEYYSKVPYKVKKIKEYGTNNLSGKSYEFTYSIYETTITNNIGITESIAFDNNGMACSRNILNEEASINDAYSIEKEFNNSNYITSSMIANKYVKNYLTNTNFESDNMIFTTESGISQSFDTSNYNYGTRCLKIEASLSEKSLVKELNINKGEYYTFSGYFLGTVHASISLSYIDANNQEIISSQLLDMNNDTFTRNDVTIFYDNNASSNLFIKITLNEIGTLYVDNVQLEKSPVVNYYNFLDNSDFSEGLIGWNCSAEKNDISVNPSNYISINNIDNIINALHINMEPKLRTNVEREFNIKGEEGDTYSISFWYKNYATIPYTQYIGSNVIIYFEPYNNENGHCILSQMLPFTNGDSWQHFTYTDTAVEDFKSIKIIFMNCGSANYFEVTNISFYKDVPQKKYLYNNDLLETIINQNEERTIDYDNKNQIIKVTDTNGTSTSYEYDSKKKNRVLNKITSSGISDYNYYDMKGNLIKSKTSKKYIDDITTRQYKIRLQGTIKYIKAELCLLLLEENDCSNTIWLLEKNGNKYKIKNGLNPSFSISYRDEGVVLDNIDSNNLFSLVKNEDNSYNILYEKPTNEGYELLILYGTNSNEIATKPYSNADNDSNFYIELTDSLFLESEKKYTSNGKFLDSETDSNLREDKYEFYESSGMLKKITNPAGIVTEYFYNNKNQCTRVKHDNIYVDYAYNNGLLSNIISGSKNYTLSYDDFRNISSVYLNNICLSTMEYQNNNGKIIKNTYGNNQNIKYSYDDYDRLCKMEKDNNIYNYYYDTNGNLSKVKSSNDETKIYYDTKNRPYKYISNDFIVNYLYNSEDCILQKKFKYKNNSHNQVNTFDNEKLLSTSLDGVLITYNYDDLNRNISKNIGNILNQSITFNSLGKRTSNIVSKYDINGDEYTCLYDDELNVKEIYLNNVLISKYEYDNYNELINEKNYNTDLEIIYTYDTSGNLVSRIYKNMNTNNTLSTDLFTYSNTNWEDQLTSYNNNAITYDAIGNMISYKNSAYTWVNGNELSNITNLNTNQSVNYQYNDQGTRTSKTINGVTTNYINLNDDIVFEDRNGTIIYYLYDCDGIIGMEYNGDNFFYIKDPQNNIVGLLDESGNRIVSYSYDSWGNILSIKDENNIDISGNANHIGIINPFRYKSYYYDSESGLYYLKHRYYNPEISRFISPDIFLGANKDVLSYNQYAYAGNNPVSNYDDNGLFVISLIITTIVSAVSKGIKVLKRITGHEKNTIPITGVFGELTPHTDYNFLAAPSFGFGTSFKAENKSRGGTVITTTKNTQGTTTEYKFYNIGFEGSESSFDLFTTTSSNGITTKTMFGVDGDYFFFGYDTEADINSYGTMGGYARYNVHKYIVYTALATAALFVTIKYVVPAAEHAVLALIPYTGPTIIHALQHACS